MPSTKTALEPRLAKDLSNNVLKLFEELGKGQNPEISKLQRFFSPNLELISNTHRVAQNLQQFQERIRNIQKRFPEIHYSRLLEEPIISGNKAIIQYTAELHSPNGLKHQSTIFAILTIEDDKIAKWQEVIHIKGSGQLDW